MNRAIVPDDDAWNAWRPNELAARLRSVREPWCVVGGWALDLWHGRQTRAHDDLEFTILREDFDVFRARFRGFALHAVDDGRVTPLSDDDALPPHVSQIWVLDVGATRWRVDMMIEPGSRETWVYKRDPTVTRPRSEMVALTSGGIPYLKPSGVLLFKAKHRRPKDETDFDTALPALPDAERGWLKSQLRLLHPDEGWQRRL